MNQTELAQISAMIDKSVDNALTRVVTTVVQPIRDELDILKRAAADLEVDDRKHSGEHKDLAVVVDRTSQNDLKQDSAIATLVTDMALVKQAQKDAKDERALTAATVRDIHTAVSGFFKQYPGVAAALATLVTALLTWGAALFSRGGH